MDFKRRVLASLTAATLASGLVALPANAANGDHWSWGNNSSGLTIDLDWFGNSAVQNKDVTGGQKNWQIWRATSNDPTNNGFMWYLPDAPESNATSHSHNWGTHYMGGTNGESFGQGSKTLGGNDSTQPGTLGQGVISDPKNNSPAGTWSDIKWDFTSKGLYFTYKVELNDPKKLMNHTWTVENKSPSVTLRGNKLFYGGDTAFAGSTQGYTDVLVGMNMLYTGNATNTTAGTLSIQGSNTTPWSGYYGGLPTPGLDAIKNNHALPNTVTGPGVINATTGLYVEWALPDLAPGQSATVQASTVIRDPETLTVMGDGAATGLPGELVAHTFLVKNSSTTTLSGISAVPSSTNGWETIMVQAPKQTLNSGESSEVLVLVRVPPGAHVGDNSVLTLTVNALQGQTALPAKSASSETSVISENAWIPDVFVGNAAISGLNMPSQTLTAQSAWSMTPDSLSYAWYHNGTLLGGQTGSSLDPTVTGVFQDGDLVRVEVTATKAGFPAGYVATAMLPIVSPVLVGSAQISGLLFEGETLLAHIAWNYQGVATSNIQWTVNGVHKPAFDGLTTFDTTGLAVGDIIWVSADGSLSGFQSATAEAGVRLGARTFQGSVAIAGLAMPGETLTAVANWSKTPSAVQYEWFVNGTLEASGSAATFDTTTYQAGDVVKVVATATHPGASPTVAESQVTLFDLPASLDHLYGSATILGLTQVGQTLTASSSWNETPDDVTYTWYVNSIDVPAGQGETFDTSSMAVGDVVYLEASAVKDEYFPAVAVTGVELFAPAEEPLDLLGSAIIDGVTVPGETLAASSEWDHQPDLVYYEWFVNDADVPDGYGRYFDTGTLKDGDKVTLVAYASLANFNLGVAAYSVMLADAPPPLPDLVGSLVIAGNLQPGHTLTAVDSWPPVDGGVSVTYQWYVDDLPVQDETNQTFDTTGVPGGSLVSVEVTGQAAGYNPVILAASTTLQMEDLNGSVAIVGRLEPGQTLAAWDEWDVTVDSVSYEWSVNGVVDQSQTGQSFDTIGLTGGDVISVVAVASKAGYNSGMASDSVELKLIQLSGSAVIKGLTVAGNTLSAETSWNENGVVEVFTWLVDNVVVLSGKASEGADQFDTTGLWGGEVITLVVDASKAGCNNGQATANETLKIVMLRGNVTIEQDSTSLEVEFVPGSVLRCVAQWNTTPDTEMVTWFRNGMPITGYSAWTLDTSDWYAGGLAACEVTAKKQDLADGKATASQMVADLPTFTGSVDITGDTTVGGTLTAVPTWELTPYLVTYQWFVNGTAVPAATNATFSTAGRSASDVVRVEVLGKVMGRQDRLVSDQVTLTQNDPGDLRLTLRGWIDVPLGYQDDGVDIIDHGLEVLTGSVVTLGTQVWWTYQVFNPSSVAVSNVTVTDAMHNNPGDPNDVICSVSLLLPGAGATCWSTKVLRTVAP